MLVLIEGVDGTGKTTLAESIERELIRGTVGMRHCSQLKRHPLDEYERDLDGYSPGLGQHIIYDRHLIGEDVYGPLYRGGSAIDAVTRWHIEAYLNSRGALLVHLTHSATELQRRHTDLNETYLQYGHVARAIETFHRVVSASNILHKVELTDPAPDDVDALVRLAQQIEHEATPLLKFPTYVGVPRPKYLLLGERRGPGAAHDPSKYVASFVPHKSTSGYFLIGSFPWRAAHHIGLANACEEDVDDLYEALGKPQVVTLGAMSHKTTQEYGVPHGQAPHPQFVRRFHNKHQEQYGHIVIEAAARRINLSDWRPR